MLEGATLPGVAALQRWAELMDRKPLIAGNWKMHATHLEAIQMVQKLSYRLDPDCYERVDVVVCPPATALRSAQTVIETDHMSIRLGAQNCHWEEKGAFTGEISPSMLAKLDVGHVIAGHSERRQLLGETDDMVNRKVKAILAHSMIPIMCVGETLQQRRGRAHRRCGDQSGRKAGLRGIGGESAGSIAIAYEPIWAIGTGRNASADDAAETIDVIRTTVGESGATTPRRSSASSTAARSTRATSPASWRNAASTEPSSAAPHSTPTPSPPLFSTGRTKAEDSTTEGGKARTRSPAVSGLHLVSSLLGETQGSSMASSPGLIQILNPDDDAAGLPGRILRSTSLAQLKWRRYNREEDHRRTCDRRIVRHAHGRQSGRGAGRHTLAHLRHSPLDQHGYTSAHTRCVRPQPLQLPRARSRPARRRRSMCAWSYSTARTPSRSQ